MGRNDAPLSTTAQFTALSTFAHVAKSLSFARAAEELGITATAVSKTVKLLENRLGVRLFNRTTRSVSLTEAGISLLSGVAPALAQLTHSLEQVQASTSSPRGVLRLNTSYVAFTTLIEPHLPEFARQYPGLVVEVAVDNELGDIVGQGYDAGMRLGHTVQHDMVAIQIGGRQQRVVVASPAYLDVHGTPRNVQEVLEHNCIRQRLHTRGKFYEWVFQVQQKPMTLNVTGQLIFDEMLSVVRASCASAGMGYVFRDFAKSEIESNRLKVVLEEFCPPGAAFYLYYPHNAQMPAKLRVFVDFLRSRHE